MQQARHGRVVEIDSLEAFDALLRRGARAMHGWRLQDIDLRGRTSQLLGLNGAGAIFLGCDLEPAAEAHLRSQGALVFQDVPNLPFNAYRASLYTPAELSAGLADGYQQSFDARVYAWSRSGDTDPSRTMAIALHDHAIDVALGEWAAGRRIVGVMGGHGMRRDAPEYRTTAHLGHQLSRAGLTVATGGGPGAMEAANLGARASGVDAARLNAAIDDLSRVPAFAGRIEAWITSALDVDTSLPPGAPSLGIPTWFYGHEPPNSFATAIAKYFQNSVREDILLRVANAGIVVLPGAGGTVQEIFQDACENSYAAEGAWAPMVLVGRDYWTMSLPAWPLLTALMRDRPAAAGIHLVDDPADAVTIVRDFAAGLPAASERPATQAR